MTARTYSSPAAFKQALEQRLRATARSGAALARKRQLLVFDRFLARVVAVLGDAATLKGGLVLELRLERARTTTHRLPTQLPDPPPAWAAPYAAMAREDQLAWPSLEEVTRAARAFLDPVLDGDLDAIWEPRDWRWRAP